MCNKCKKMNHFAAQCRARNVANGEANETSEEVILAIGKNGKRKPIFTILRINDREIKFQVDSGAAVNVITRKDVQPELITATKTTLKMWNDTTLIRSGKCQLEAVTKNGKKPKVEFIVVNEKLTPPIGR